MTEIERDAHRIQPLHDVEDEAKLESLIESMRVNGWQGAPVVVVEREDSDPLAATGSHRVAAAREVGIEVPTINAAELLAEHGGDFAALVGEFETAGLDREGAEYEAIIRIVDYLPADVAEHYGLDAH